MTEGGGVGGRTSLGLRRRFSLLFLMGRMAPAQPLTVWARDFLFFFFCFRSEGSALSDSDPRSDDETVWAREAESEELELMGRDFVDMFEGPNVSSPKNDHRFGALVGLGNAGPAANGSPTLMSAGIEFRRLGDVFACSGWALATVSRMAPAVDGLDSRVSLIGLRERTTGL